MNSELFAEQEHTQKYRLRRPGYPTQLFDYIINYYFNGDQNNKSIPLALDIACGSGQATVQISSFCDRVIGIDVSTNQIDQAIHKDNIEYRCQKAEDLTFLEPNSVDLITVATGLHWLDVELFVEQVKRVLKPNTGVLAVWTYGAGKLEHSEADAVYHEFDQIILSRYWDSRRWHTDNFYQTLLPLLPYKSTLVEYTIEKTFETTIEKFIELTETFSGLQTYKKQEGEQAYEDLIENFRKNLINCFIKGLDETQTNRIADLNSIKLSHANPIKLYLMRKNETN